MSRAEPNPDGASSAEQAEKLARPTFWPAGIAFGITLFAWGLITSIVLVGFGLAVFIVSLIGWIGELRHE